MSGVSQTLLYHNGCNDPSFQLCATFPAQSHYTLIQQREIQAGAAAVFLTTEAAESTSHWISVEYVWRKSHAAS